MEHFPLDPTIALPKIPNYTTSSDIVNKYTPLYKAPSKMPIAPSDILFWLRHCIENALKIAQSINYKQWNSERQI